MEARKIGAFENHPQLQYTVAEASVCVLCKPPLWNRVSIPSLLLTANEMCLAIYLSKEQK